MTKILYLMLIFLIVCGCSNQSMKVSEIGVMKIDTETVFHEIDNRDVYIIDVREDYEYMAGHIRNAYNIPLAKIHDISKMMISLDSKIIVYCHSGNRSRQAATLLMEMGYISVYDMGGIDNWDYELIRD